MIRAVLFDLDDTLFDHHHSAGEALAGVRSCHACFSRFDHGELEHIHGRLLEDLHARVMAGELGLNEARMERFRRLFAAAGLPADDEMVAAAASAYRERYLSSWRPVPGAPALLMALECRVRIGVVSNNLLEEQQEKIRHCGFQDHIDVLVVSEEAGVSKPDPAIFRIALERLHCEADEAVMIGDSWQADVAGARAAGIRAIWLNRLAARMPEPAADVVELAALEPIERVLDAVFAKVGRDVRSSV